MNGGMVHAIIIRKNVPRWDKSGLSLQAEPYTEYGNPWKGLAIYLNCAIIDITGAECKVNFAKGFS